MELTHVREVVQKYQIECDLFFTAWLGKSKHWFTRATGWNCGRTTCKYRFSSPGSSRGRNRFYIKTRHPINILHSLQTRPVRLLSIIQRIFWFSSRPIASDLTTDAKQQPDTTAIHLLERLDNKAIFPGIKKKKSSTSSYYFEVCFPKCCAMQTGSFLLIFHTSVSGS